MRWLVISMGFLGVAVVKNSPASEGNAGDKSQEDPLEEEVATHSVRLPGGFHGQKSLAGYSPYGRKEWDMAEQLSRHTHM